MVGALQQQRQGMLVVVLDEVDQLLSRNPATLYELFRLPQVRNAAGGPLCCQQGHFALAQYHMTTWASPPTTAAWLAWPFACSAEFSAPFTPWQSALVLRGYHVRVNCYPSACSCPARAWCWWASRTAST